MWRIYLYHPLIGIKIWKSIVIDVKNLLHTYNDVYTTFDAKSIITKSLILPKVSYTATVLNIPSDIFRSLENLIVKYVIPKGNISIPLTELARKRNSGGYNIDHVLIHASVFSLMPIFKYIKCKVENIPLSNEQFFIEYNLGMQFKSLFGIQKVFLF